MAFKVASTFSTLSREMFSLISFVARRKVPRTAENFPRAKNKPASRNVGHKTSRKVSLMTTASTETQMRYHKNRRAKRSEAKIKTKCSTLVGVVTLCFARLRNRHNGPWGWRIIENFQFVSGALGMFVECASTSDFWPFHNRYAAPSTRSHDFCCH